MRFTDEMEAWLQRDPTLLDKLIWTDEAIFFVGGFVNKHNCHYWASTNPHMIFTKSQNRLKVTVWCGMTSSRLIGPFILRETMNGDRYLQMLQQDVWPEVSTWPNADELVFMQDGAPPHYKRDVRNWLNANFQDRWIGRAGPQEWPARSPDLTPCDFFLWGFLKEQVYKTNPKNLDDLELSITEAIRNIPVNFIQKACHAVPNRLQKLRRKNGGHIEF